MAETMKATGQTTKKGAVEAAMRDYVRAVALKDLVEGMRGIEWDDPAEARKDRMLAEDPSPFDDKQ
jgi:Arc/MetJ family transcription regulator